MQDYHIHPNYSIDAKGELDEFCEAALKAGLTEIAFTTHLDSDPATNDNVVLVEGKLVDVKSDYWLQHYEQSIREIGDVYAEQGLIVLLGVELELYPGVAGNLPDCFFSTDFDLILGSAHLIDHLAISVEKEAMTVFAKHTMQDLGEKYFNLLMDGIDEGLVDILAHIDLYRRYGELFYEECIKTLWEPHIEELTKRMKKRDVGFEINTSTWRKGQVEPMPSPELASVLISKGIDRVTVGSDAHEPSFVGSGIERAIKILQEIGIANPTRMRHRKRII